MRWWTCARGTDCGRRRGEFLGEDKTRPWDRHGANFLCMRNCNILSARATGTGATQVKTRRTSSGFRAFCVADTEPQAGYIADTEGFRHRDEKSTNNDRATGKHQNTQRENVHIMPLFSQAASLKNQPQRSVQETRLSRRSSNSRNHTPKNLAVAPGPHGGRHPRARRGLPSTSAGSRGTRQPHPTPRNPEPPRYHAAA